MIGRGAHWISVSDLMAGLMMIFMFIAIVFMLKTEQETEKIREIALTYSKYQQSLYTELKKQFKDDLPKWGAKLLPDNTIRFTEPDILFERSSDKINEQFSLILDDFFPRYISILNSDKFRENIDEIRIEGHTSSLWQAESSLQESYLHNARLSQARSLSVLSYVFQLESFSDETRNWMIEFLRANGLSYAKRIKNASDEEDFERSRRVEFRVITKSEEKIYQIVESFRGIKSD